MAFSIVLNQAGRPAGVAGRAREDLALGVPVVASISGGPFSQYAWSLSSRPIDIVAAVRSSAALATPTASSTQVSPIDVAGTYLLEAVVNSGAGLGARDDDVETITFYAGPTLAVDPRMLPRRVPAFGERGEHNAPDAIDPSGNAEAWAREMRRWFAVVSDLYEGRLWAGGRVAYASGYSLLRGRNVSASIPTFGGGGAQVAFLNALPDADYALHITPIRTTAGKRVLPYDVVPSASGFTVLFRDLALDALINSSFSFRAELAL